MKYNVKVVIFDFDGVIVDSGEDIANAVQYSLKHFGRPVLPKEEIIGYVGHGAEMLIRSCFKGCNEELVSRAVPFYKSYYLENAIVHTKLYDNVKETLECLKLRMEGKKTALVTNKPEALTYRILEGLGVREYFDWVVGPESVARLKPDPEGILKVLGALGYAPGSAVMVGDSHTDIEAGRKAGTVTCAVTFGLGDRVELMKASPDFSIDDMRKLLEYIE